MFDGGQSHGKLSSEVIAALAISGLLLARVASAQLSDIPEDGERFNMHFEDASLSTIVELFADLTKRTIDAPNLRLDPIRVSYSAERPMTRREVWQAFEEILDSKMLMVTESDDVWHVVDRSEAIDGSETEARFE